MTDKHIFEQIKIDNGQKYITTYRYGMRFRPRSIPNTKNIYDSFLCFVNVKLDRFCQLFCF